MSQSEVRSESRESANPVYSDDEIDLKQLARAVWRYRYIVVLLAVIGAVAGFGISQLSSRYVAEGLFLSPGLSLPSYKRYEVALKNRERLNSFIALSRLEGTQTAGLFERLGTKTEEVSKAIRPEFAITGKEAKGYDVPSVESGELLGIDILVERKEKTEESPIKNLAEYIRHTLIEVDLGDVFLQRCLQFGAREVELNQQRIASEFEAKDAAQRAATLREILASNPRAADVETRQVVSIESGSERFLSPTTQLVAIEIGMAEAKLANERRERELLAARLKKKYYCDGLEVQKKPQLGQQLLASLQDLHDSVFQGEDMTSMAIEQVSSELLLERRGWENRFLHMSRFIVSPDGGETIRRTPERPIGALIGLVLGAGGGLLLTLILAWWHDHREEVISADDAV